MLGVLFALGLSGGAVAARNPWAVHCASMPLEHALPAPLARAEHAFAPWGGSAVPRGLAAGPVYLVAGSYRTAISRDGDFTDSSGEYLHRALVAVAPSFTGPVTISGRRLQAGARTNLGFSTDGALRCFVGKLGVACTQRPLAFGSRLTIAGGAGWRIVPTELRIGRTGCFQLTVSGPRLHETIPLAVPGPDWRTPGWR